MSSLPKLEEECFFIAPIGQDGSSERNRSDGVLEFVVARAAEELGLQAVRGDQIAEPGQITLQVIEHVLGSKTAVADLTGQNPNVYYELAIRHTAKLPTVLICEQGERLPFDIAHMRTIFFSHTDLRSADRCRADIVRHLRQALDGAVDSPVTASVDLQRLTAGNTVERTVADLVNNVSNLEKALHNVTGEVRIARRQAGIKEIFERTAARQQIVAQDLNRQLSDLLRLARKRKDGELEQLVMQAFEIATALAFSFSASLPSQTDTTGKSSKLRDLVETMANSENPLSSILIDYKGGSTSEYSTPAGERSFEVSHEQWPKDNDLT